MAGDALSLPGHLAAEIRREAERAKHALTHTAECLVILRDVEFTRGDSRDVPILVDRRTFDALSAHLTAEVVRTVQHAIREAEEFRLSDGRIDRDELSDIDFILLAVKEPRFPHCSTRYAG